MNRYSGIAMILCLMSTLIFAQTQPIKTYPGATTQETTKAPLIPPIITQIVIALIGVLIFLVMVSIFIIVVLLLIRHFFGNKVVPEAEKLKKERISKAKSWSGSNLDFIALLGDDKKVPSSIIGYCSGFAAEANFDYITYHTGLPSYMLLFRLLKGPKFQLHIPIIDLTIPSDHIIQVEPDLHTAPGRTIFIFASGLMNSTDYEIPNTTTISISKRMKFERADIISRTHSETASMLPQLGEKFWESTKEHYKKRDAESAKSQSGR